MALILEHTGKLQTEKGILKWPLWNSPLQIQPIFHVSKREWGFRKVTTFLEPPTFFTIFVSGQKITFLLLFRMFKNVVTALAESRDITLYLSPLMKHFLQFEETDFSESKPLLKPLMHCVSLVCWLKNYSIFHNKRMSIGVGFQLSFRKLHSFVIIYKYKALSNLFLTKVANLTSLCNNVSAVGQLQLL